MDLTVITSFLGSIDPLVMLGIVSASVISSVAVRSKMNKKKNKYTRFNDTEDLKTEDLERALGNITVQTKIFDEDDNSFLGAYAKDEVVQSEVFIAPSTKLVDEACVLDYFDKPNEATDCLEKAINKEKNEKEKTRLKIILKEYNSQKGTVTLNDIIREYPSIYVSNSLENELNVSSLKSYIKPVSPQTITPLNPVKVKPNASTKKVDIFSESLESLTKKNKTLAFQQNEKNENNPNEQLTFKDHDKKDTLPFHYEETNKSKVKDHFGFEQSVEKDTLAFYSSENDNSNAQFTSPDPLIQSQPIFENEESNEQFGFPPPIFENEESNEQFGFPPPIFESDYSSEQFGFPPPIVENDYSNEQFGFSQPVVENNISNEQFGFPPPIVENDYSNEQFGIAQPVVENNISNDQFNQFAWENEEITTLDKNSTEAILKDLKDDADSIDTFNENQAIEDMKNFWKEFGSMVTDKSEQPEDTMQPVSMFIDTASQVKSDIKIDSKNHEQINSLDKIESNPFNEIEIKEIDLNTFNENEAVQDIQRFWQDFNTMISDIQQEVNQQTGGSGIKKSNIINNQNLPENGHNAWFEFQNMITDIKEQGDLYESLLTEESLLNKTKEESMENEENKQDFWQNFGNLVSDIQNDVNSSQDLKNNNSYNLPFQSNENNMFKVWVNWIIDMDKNKVFKNEFFELENSWGSSLASEELSEKVNQLSGTDSFGNNYPWVLVSVFPVDK